MSWWWLLGLWPFVALAVALVVCRGIKIADEQECPLNDRAEEILA